jgi:hypothetical protein
MTIENTLERIAVALERLADAKHTETFLKPEATASTDEIAASMAVAGKAAVATEAKRRGRPAKIVEAAPEVTPQVTPEVTPQVEVTKDALRAALVAYQGLCGNDPKPARAIMATHGGADVLAKVPVERYAIVLQAVNDAAAKLKT